jgi:galactokinase
VTAHPFLARLAAAGLDSAELPSKARLLDSVLTSFERLAGDSPAYLCWVPGRLEVFGTHTDYAGGRVLVCAVPRGFVFAAAARTDGHLRVADAAGDESMSTVAGPQGGDFTGWRHYVEVVVDRLSRNFPGARFGADVVFASDLPRAAGMSSSSALVVGTASSLVELAQLRDRLEWQVNVPDPLAAAGYYACIENGRTFAGLAGTAGVGTHGGSEDHAAMICGEAATLSAYAFVPMRRIDAVRLPPAWSFAIASSGVAAEKTGSALAAYNRLSEGATRLLDIWNAAETPRPSLADALASAPSAAGRLRSLASASGSLEWTAEALEARLRHFIAEDARVPAAVQAFRTADASQIAGLAASSHADAEQLLGNQVVETTSLVSLALGQGAIASRSFGAGFGGSVWAVVERGRAAAFAGEWLAAYRRRHPAAERAVAFGVQPGPALVDLRL